MERVHKIWEHSLYQEQLQLLTKAEEDRIFCRHTLEHFLDVSRLLMIYNLEEGLNLDKELIYSVGLLHDIGRYRQIADGTPHEVGSAAFAEEIMKDCGFDAEEICEVQQAILSHRKKKNGTNSRLGEYLYKADKQSRNCFCCPALDKCNWSMEKRNLTIVR